MTAGKLFYKYFFKPTLPLRYNLSHFGLKDSTRMWLGERLMKKTAKTEPPITVNNRDDLPVFCFLTGKNYWHQTVYVIKSLSRQLGGNFGIKIFSDGSLTVRHQLMFKHFAPNLEIIDPDIMLQHLDITLPENQFPTLRFLRNWHPFFKRMIDIHCFMPGWSIHLDSDMLFFNKPVELTDAFYNKKAIFMKDSLSESYYADNENILKKRFGIICLNRVNGGVIAYDSAKVDYIDLEKKARLLIENYKHTGPARIEQTLMSYLLYKQNAVALDSNLYKIYFNNENDSRYLPTVKHYIFKAKLQYLTTEWKQFRH